MKHRFNFMKMFYKKLRIFKIFKSLNSNDDNLVEMASIQNCPTGVDSLISCSAYMPR